MSAAPTDCRVPDPTDAKADGGFGNHRAGYSPDRLAQAEHWARKGGTLNAGEGLILCAEIDRLRDDLKYAQALLNQLHDSERLQDEIDRLRKELVDVERDKTIYRLSAQAFAKDKIRFEQILAALREPSEAVINHMALPLALSPARWAMAEAIRAAVAAAEREVRHDEG